jgi:uncharacterized protein YbbK (DUF523 family)
MKNKPYILISSCLLGLHTQWDEDCKKIEELIELVKEGKAIFFCPEQGGGLSTPRIPSEIEYGKTSSLVLSDKAKVLSKEGKDVTKEFVNGAKMALQLCKEFDLKIAILKAKSPSCGSMKTYDGSFTGTKRKGSGITAELLKQNGIKVYNEENFPSDL